MFNVTLFKPGNLILIALIALGSHIVAKPLYKMIDG